MSSETTQTAAQTAKYALLDPDRKSPRAAEFEDKLSGLIVGQERAVRRMSGLFQIYLASMNNPRRPAGTLLFLGPTGSGKTRVVEAAAEILFGDPGAVVKIDCAEFQHSHEIAKLIGSPPGYLGHRETSPLLTQDNLDKSHTEDTKLTFVLFDEIEKASDALWQLLLGILDKATLTLGDNRRVDFSQTVVIMTSNLGAREMSEMISGGIGFAPHHAHNGDDHAVDTKIYRTALEAAKKKFSPEFMNRIDKVVVFRSLKKNHIAQILGIELKLVQDRITESAYTKFVFECTDTAKEFLLHEGIDYKYGARHLKRAIERFLVYPLSNLVATEQVETGDLVIVDFDDERKGLVFNKQPGKMIVNDGASGAEAEPDPYDEVRDKNELEKKKQTKTPLASAVSKTATASAPTCAADVIRQALLPMIKSRFNFDCHSFHLYYKMGETPLPESLRNFLLVENYPKGNGSMA